MLAGGRTHSHVLIKLKIYVTKSSFFGYMGTKEVRGKMQSFHLAVSDRETSLVSGTGEAQAERHQ